MGRRSRQAASDSWDKMVEKAERDLEIKTRRRDRKNEIIRLQNPKITAYLEI